MSGNSGISLAVGIVLGVVGFIIGGPVGALYGFTLGTTAAGLILGPDDQAQQTIKPDELKITTSSEAQTIPVVFGTARVSGNHLGYSRDSFKSIELTESTGGKGGGGGEQVTGILYKLTYQVGLCMGPIDELVKVTGSPGDDNVLWKETQLGLTATSASITVSNDRITQGTVDFFEDAEVGMSVFVEGAVGDDNKRVRGNITSIDPVNAAWIELTPGTFQGGDETGLTLDLTLVVTNDAIDMSTGVETFSLAGRAEDGGSVTLYQGTPTQTGIAINSKIYNYRNVAFAHFGNYTLGGQATPRSYLFEVRRMPVCLDSVGSAVVGMQARASANTEEAEYNDANPAAVVWEIMTNEVWGKGMSPDLLDEADFVRASNYYLQHRIGISTAMGGEGSMNDLLEKLRVIYGLAVWWEGDILKARVVWDRENAYSERIRITQEDVIDTPVFSRGAIAKASSELRLDFTNRVNNYQKEGTTRQDLAVAEEMGYIRSERIDAAEIGTRRTAELLNGRLLRELAYPAGKCQLTVQRAHADLQNAALVELYWPYWRSTGWTSFWRVDNVKDDESDAGNVVLTLSEDLWATSVDGEITDFEAPIISLDVDVPLDDDDFGAIDYTTALPLGALTPILVDEMPIWISKGNRELMVAVQRRNQSIQSVQVGFSEAATLDFQTIGALRPFAITGQLLDDIDAGGPKIIRQTVDQFGLNLNRSDDGIDLLDQASYVQDGTEHFSDITNTARNILIVNGEIMRVGFIEESSPGVYTIRTAIRGELGSQRAAHLTGDNFWFFGTFDPSRTKLAAGNVPIDAAVKVRLQPFAASGSGDATIVDGPDSLGFNGDSIRPASPSFSSAERTGNDWTVRIRPVIHWGGAGYGPDFESEMLEELDTIDPMRVRIERPGGDSITVSEFFAAGSQTDGDLEVTRAEWIPPVRGDGDTGMIVLEFTTTSTVPATMNIYQRWNGRDSEALVVDNPA